MAVSHQRHDIKRKSRCLPGDHGRDPVYRNVRSEYSATAGTLGIDENHELNLRILTTESIETTKRLSPNRILLTICRYVLYDSTPVFPDLVVCVAEKFLLIVYKFSTR